MLKIQVSINDERLSLDPLLLRRRYAENTLQQDGNEPHVFVA